ncbi:MAG: hypothetical protein ACLT22_17100 [Coprobacillus cateniformis]
MNHVAFVTAIGSQKVITSFSAVQKIILGLAVTQMAGKMFQG